MLGVVVGSRLIHMLERKRSDIVIIRASRAASSASVMSDSRGILAQINRQPAGFPLVNYYGAQICATGSVEFRPACIADHLLHGRNSKYNAPYSSIWRSGPRLRCSHSIPRMADGVPASDLLSPFLLLAGHCYALELKERGGRLTPVQRDAHAALVAARATVEVAYGLDDALARLEAWGLVRGSCQGLRP